MVPCHASNVEGDVNERQTRLLGNTVVEQLWQQLNSFSSSYSRYTQVIRLRFPCGIASLAQVSTMGLCPLLSHCNCRPVAKPVLEGITRTHTHKPFAPILVPQVQVRWICCAAIPLAIVFVGGVAICTTAIVVFILQLWKWGGLSIHAQPGPVLIPIGGVSSHLHCLAPIL